MARRADRPERGGLRKSAPPPRFEIDRVWLLRVAVAVVVLVAFVLIGKVSIMAFGGGGKRLERLERDAEEKGSPPTAETAKPSSPR